MAFRYDCLWNIIAQRGWSKQEFRDQIGASQTTIVKLGRNENVSLDIIDRICDALNCTPDDFLTYISPTKVRKIVNLQNEIDKVLKED